MLSEISQTEKISAMNTYKMWTLKNQQQKSKFIET